PNLVVSRHTAVIAADREQAICQVHGGQSTVLQGVEKGTETAGLRTARGRAAGAVEPGHDVLAFGGPGELRRRMGTELEPWDGGSRGCTRAPPTASWRGRGRNRLCPDRGQYAQGTGL